MHAIHTWQLNPGFLGFAARAIPIFPHGLGVLIIKNHCFFWGGGGGKLTKTKIAWALKGKISTLFKTLLLHRSHCLQLTMDLSRMSHASNRNAQESLMSLYSHLNFILNVSSIARNFDHPRHFWTSWVVCETGTLLCFLQ